MKILLTGGTGFIGSHMAEALTANGYEVVPFDRKQGLDVTEPEVVRRVAFECDGIFNLAGVLGTHELNAAGAMRGAVEVNIIGALNCLAAASEFDIPLLQIAKPNVWLNTYSITKQASEDFTRLYVKELGVKAWIVRWFNVYGPGQHYGSPQKLGPTSIVKALKGEPVPVFGDGQQTADHIYVKDAVDAALAVFECDAAMGIPVDVGTGDDVTVSFFVTMVLEGAGSKSEVEFLPMRSGEAEHAIVKADITFLKDVVGWKPKYSLEDGLRETIDWYRENLP
jgi:UDP-glucose 4-epimerase